MSNDTSMRLKWIASLFIFFVVISLYYLGNTVKSQSSSNSEKQIGTIDQFGNFISQTQLNKDENYWVRVRVNGKDTNNGGGAVQGGNDIYMSLDVSSSMADYIPRSGGGQIRRVDAAKNASRQFVNLLDGDNSDSRVDYAGFGTFNACKDYSADKIPITWMYEDYFNLQRGGYARHGRAASHSNMRMMDATGKSSIQSVINSLTFYDGSSNTSEPVTPEYCRSGNPLAVGEDGGTSIAAGVTLGNTFLTPIISNARRPYDNSLFSNANLGIVRNHPGSQFRDISGTTVKKYLVLFSDGGESARPFLNEQDLDRSGRTVVQNAQRYNVKIYVVSYRPPGPGGYQRLVNIAAQTGGQIYDGRSESGINNAYNAIASEIRNNTTSTKTKSATKVTETINGNNFVIDEPALNTSFKITQTGSGGSDQNITDTACPNLNCISNKQYSGGLKGFDVDLGDLGSSDSRYIYFRVRATTVGTNIKVDSDTSNLQYIDFNQTEILDNTTVNIINDKFYFTLQNGNIYSNAGGSESIKSTMRMGQFFTRGPHSVVMANGAISLGQGTIGQSRFGVYSYADSERLQYADLYESYSSSLNRISINGVSSMSTSGYYIDNSTINSGKMTLNGNGWRNQNVVNKNIVVFVPGDLFISEPFTIAKNGQSSITFVVNGNVGINTSVRNLHAVIIADGIIDTACNQTTTFSTSNPCLPSMDTDFTKLTFEGMMYAGGGILLDRGGVTTDPGWGEEFVYRPDITLSLTDTLGSILYSWKENKE